MSDYELHMR